MKNRENILAEIPIHNYYLKLNSPSRQIVLAVWCVRHHSVCVCLCVVSVHRAMKCRLRFILIYYFLIVETNLFRSEIVFCSLIFTSLIFVDKWWQTNMVHKLICFDLCFWWDSLISLFIFIHLFPSKMALLLYIMVPWRERPVLLQFLLAFRFNPIDEQQKNECDDNLRWRYAYIQIDIAQLKHKEMKHMEQAVHFRNWCIN